ncbi:MAG: heme utilization cystosolic carrier protein HutX [Shewanella sp.]
MNMINHHIIATLQAEPQASPSDLAQKLEVSELLIYQHLPPQQVHWLPSALAQELLEALPEWGNLMTIVLLAGNVFEFKGPFPKGKLGHGYFNLYSKHDGMYGHLLLSSFAAIALVSRPLRGRASYAICFFAASGDVIFKIYLGRDQAGELFPEQVHNFNQLKQLTADC